MDLSALLIFKTVVEEGGILRAAKKLHRVQSNVTTRIKQLEQSLDTQLFFRSKQRLFLSPSGELLLDYAQRLLRLADEAKAAVAGDAPKGVLRLGALESTTASRLPAVFCAFHARFPDVRIQLGTGTNDALVEQLLSRDIDAAFVAQAPSSNELSYLSIFTEQLVVICALDHKPITHSRDVVGESIITFPAGCAYRRVMERWLGDASLGSRNVLELGAYHAIVACVAAGAGVAILPESVLDTVQSSEVMRHQLPKALRRVVTPLVWRKGERNPAVHALCGLVRESFRSMD